MSVYWSPLAVLASIMAERAGFWRALRHVKGQQITVKTIKQIKSDIDRGWDLKARSELTLDCSISHMEWMAFWLQRLAEFSDRNTSWAYCWPAQREADGVRLPEQDDRRWIMWFKGWLANVKKWVKKKKKSLWIALRYERWGWKTAINTFCAKQKSG